MKRILRVPVPERVIVVGRLECGKVRGMVRRLMMMRMMGGGAMIVCRQFPGFVIVDVNMIAASVCVEEEPGVKQGQRHEEQA